MLTAREYALQAGLSRRTVSNWAVRGYVQGARKTTRPGLLGEVWEAPLEAWEAVRASPPRRGPKAPEKA